MLGEAPELPHDEAPDGLLEQREGLCLYVLARRAERLGDLVEIGAYRGRSTWYLASALRDAASPRRLVSIDPHLEGTHDDYERNLVATGARSVVEAHRAYSYDVAGRVDGPLGLLWIDGDHSYGGVRRDFEQWYPKLAVGGWLALHDTLDQWYGPTRLARELLVRRNDLIRVGVVGTLLFCQRTSPSFGNRVSGLRARIAFELAAAARRHAFGRGPRNTAQGDG